MSGKSTTRMSAAVPKPPPRPKAKHDFIRSLAEAPKELHRPLEVTHRASLPAAVRSAVDQGTRRVWPRTLSPTTDCEPLVLPADHPYRRGVPRTPELFREPTPEPTFYAFPLTDAFKPTPMTNSDPPQDTKPGGNCASSLEYRWWQKRARMNEKRKKSRKGKTLHRVADVQLRGYFTAGYRH